EEADRGTTSNRRPVRQAPREVTVALHNAPAADLHHRLPRLAFHPKTKGGRLPGAGQELPRLAPSQSATQEGRRRDPPPARSGGEPAHPLDRLLRLRAGADLRAALPARPLRARPDCHAEFRPQEYPGDGPLVG